MQPRLLVLLGLQQQIEGHDRDTARRAIDWLPTDSSKEGTRSVNKGRSKGDGIHWVRRFLAGYLCSCLVVSVSHAAELKKETIRSWDEYIQTSRSQMQDRLQPNGQFLWVDEEPQRNRQVRAGKILVSPGSQKVPQPVTSGLIHDWIGAAFIPN